MLFLTLINTKKDIQQIRYIDKNGLEIIRTQRDLTDHVFLATDKKLEK